MNEGRRPLDGVKCVGVLTYQQGPVCFSMMADLGASVIKIEQPGKGEQGRWTQPAPELTWRPYYETHNRGFKSLTLNYQKPKGLEILLKLIKDADIFGINLRPGVPERYGFSYEDMIKINPDIVFLNMTAYGPKGPSSELPGMDIVAQAMGGVASIFGEEGTQMMTGTIALADEVAAYINFQAAIVGLYHAKMTGEGQQIDTSLLGGQIRLMGQRITSALNTGKNPKRARTRVGGGKAPLFAGNFTDKDGKPFVIQMVGEDKWANAVKNAQLEEELTKIGCLTLADFVTNEEKTKLLVKTMDKVLKTNTRDYWIKLLRSGDTIAAPLNRISEAAVEPDAIVNGYVTEVDHPRYGKIKEVGFPWNFHKTPARAGIAPELGEHNDEILRGLGYSAGEIQQFSKEGII
jgi:crotonobetainyl-CoA:carnitine CoA-transferase CaiB-like acyl-CoA transferase